MTLKRLMIVLGALMILAGVGIACLWQYAYSPSGRARVIIAQLKGDTASARGWLLQHHVIRPGFAIPPQAAVARQHLEFAWDRGTAAAEAEMARLGPKALPVVIEALHDENRFVRMMAIGACGKLHDPVAVAPLIQCMRDAARRPPNFDVQLRCLDALVEIGPECYGPLMEASRQCDPRIRWGIPGTLAEKWGAAAVPRLVEMLDDSDAFLRAFAAIELGQLKDRRAADALIRRLGDSEETVVTHAAQALGKIGDPKAIPALLAIFKDQRTENDVRISTAGAMANLGRNEGLNYLLAMVKSPNPDDRGRAAYELGDIQTATAYGPLVSLLSDGTASVRIFAVQGLGDLRDPRAIPAVRKLLNDPDSGVKEHAARALQLLAAKIPQASQPGKP